jgi:hypothetical protein
VVLVTSVLAWFSLSAIGLGLIVLSEPVWSRRLRRAEVVAPRVAPRAERPDARSCCGCSA